MRTSVNTKTDKYTVDNGKVFQNYSKKLTFDAVVPFMIYDSSSTTLNTKCGLYRDVQMERSDVSVSFVNMAPSELLVKNVELVPSKRREHVVKSEGREGEFYMKNGEEYSALFSIRNKEMFMRNDYYTVCVQWVNGFDCKMKECHMMIQNKSKMRNEVLDVTVSDKPDGEVAKGRNFKIAFNVRNKTKMELTVNVYVERFTHSEQDDVKEFEVMDIVDSKFQLRESMSFSLVCRSDNIGVVYMPVLHISYGDNKIMSFDKILYFNCVEE